MSKMTLAQSVEKFSHITQGVPDAELDRAWAWGAYDSEGVRFAFFRTYEELRELATKISFERAAHEPISSALRDHRWLITDPQVHCSLGYNDQYTGQSGFGSWRCLTRRTEDALPHQR